MEKILARNDLKLKIDAAKKAGKKVIFTNGCFDIIHAGHTHYLAKARDLGDILIVGVNSDASVRGIKGEKRPLVPEDERAEVIAALGCVDFVVIFEEPDPQALVDLLRPDVLVKGGDWREEDVIGRESVASWGGKVVIIPHKKGLSTTNIVERIKAVYS
ncbi:MAG: D-glycero-beta-D-manno-heptose 1-phosphate adenylyltransferase [Syntrophaceae bacterium]